MFIPFIIEFIIAVIVETCIILRAKLIREEKRSGNCPQLEDNGVSDGNERRKDLRGTGLIWWGIYGFFVFNSFLAAVFDEEYEWSDFRTFLIIATIIFLSFRIPWIVSEKRKIKENLNSGLSPDFISKEEYVSGKDERERFRARVEVGISDDAKANMEIKECFKGLCDPCYEKLLFIMSGSGKTEEDNTMRALTSPAQDISQDKWDSTDCAVINRDPTWKKAMQDPPAVENKRNIERYYPKSQISFVAEQLKKIHRIPVSEFTRSDHVYAVCRQALDRKYGNGTTRHSLSDVWNSK